MSTIRTPEMPEAPVLGDLARYLCRMPPFIARKRVDWFTGGAVSPRTLANADAYGTGPRARQVINGNIVYPTEFLLEWLEGKGVTTIAVPQI